MTRALVLMKAMPPTKGHERLIEFAKKFCDMGMVLMDTAPDEPLQRQRWDWVAHHAIDGRGWFADWLKVDDQDPASKGFWLRWKSRIDSYGDFDYVIGSEPYCAKVAEVIGARYIPYDPKRELLWTKATSVRTNPLMFFDSVADDFKRHMQTTVTIFGAESTGKTTLSKELEKWWRAEVEWVFEWARPFLESRPRPYVDLQDMHDIWHGQYAVEENAQDAGKAFIVRDTDLYSTIGYWEQPHWKDELGPVPNDLISDAKFHKADLYIITKSDIPFEKDPLRYGGDHRESPDEYWISVAEKYDLNYVVLTGDSLYDRLANAQHLLRKAFADKNADLMNYSRELVKS